MEDIALVVVPKIARRGYVIGLRVSVRGDAIRAGKGTCAISGKYVKHIVNPSMGRVYVFHTRMAREGCVLVNRIERVNGARASALMSNGLMSGGKTVPRCADTAQNYRVIQKLAGAHSPRRKTNAEMAL